MGMVGGGRGAFIGAVHRSAAELDGLVELVAGALSSDPARALASGRDYRLAEDRVYPSFEDMLRTEKELPAESRIDFVAVVAPNDVHLPASRLALESGFPVVCDKPLARNLEEARSLEAVVRESGLPFALTHNYSGYPMIKEARERVRVGELGRIRRVVVEYAQGWLATALETTGHKQASWRADPERAGASCCLGDIGTHAFQLAEYVTGARVTELAADVSTFVAGRKLDDDGSILLRFDDGAKGVLWASQVAAGEENGLALRVYGERGGLAWRQEEPSTLVVSPLEGPRLRLRAGANLEHLSPLARRACRLPGGHPEGYIEAFANLYRSFARALAARLEGRTPDPADLDVPGIEDGVRGMAFIEAALGSSAKGAAWTALGARTAEQE